MSRPLALLAIVTLCFACGGSPPGTVDEVAAPIDAADTTTDADGGVAEDVQADAANDSEADADGDADDAQGAQDAQDADDAQAARDTIAPRDADDAGDAGDADSADTAVEADAADGLLDVPDTAPPCVTVDDAIERAVLVIGADWTPVVAEACARVAVPVVVPAGTRVAFEGRGLPVGARLAVYPAPWWVAQGASSGPLPLGVSERATSDDATLSVEATAVVAGEHWLVIERDDPTKATDVELRATCRAGCDAESTRFPIVLLHGYAGVDSYFGVLDYFFDVVDTLGERGFVAWTPVVDAIATSETRAAQLAPQIEEVLRITGARRVNMVAHSQGGLDARWLISQLGFGDRVASLTTVATPHGGIPALLFDFFSVQDFGDDAMAAFNAAAVDDPRVRYWSWAFRSCQLLQFGCVRDSDGETVDAFLIATHTLLLRFGENDGIVPTDRMVWGELLGLRFADHFDQVGQIADGTSRNDPFDHREFYLGEARRLAGEGL